jgi:hypothetical protein
MAISSDRYRSEFHRVVLSAHPCGRQEKPQDLRIRLGSPAGHEVEQQKHQQPAEQAVKQVERGRAQAHGEEKKLSFGPKDGQWAGKRAMHSIDSSGFCHVLLPRNAGESVAGKQPSEEIHGGDGHADAEQHAGKYPFRATFAESERKTSHHNRNE